MADDHTSGAEQKGVITKVLNPPIKGAHYTGHEIHDALRFQGSARPNCSTTQW